MLAQLAQLLIACRVVTAEQWQSAAAAGAGDLAKTLDALAAEPAWWAAGGVAFPQDHLWRARRLIDRLSACGFTLAISEG